MKIQDALKETGKAIREEWREYPEETYLTLEPLTSSEEKQFFQYDINENGCKHGQRYGHVNLLDNNWQPYHDKPVIRPEKPGELWRHNETEGYFHTDYSTQDASLVLIGYKGVSSNAEIVHGTHWTREFPPVEDEGVDILKLAKEVGDVGYKGIERIEIHGIGWNQDSDGGVFPYQDSDEFDWKQLVDRPYMKVIFEIPREA